MRTAFAAGVALLIVVAAVKADDVPKRDPEVEALVDWARTLPPEFAIDLLLRFANSPKVTDPTWKRELVEDAWNRTYWVGEPYRLMALMPPADSRASAQTLGYDMRLDRMSLQTRATRAMIPLSRERAREMFEWIDFELKPSSCDNPMVPALDDYYDTLAILARSAFGTSSDDRADALLFLELYSWRASRPTEMASLARALNLFKPTPDEAQYFESVVGWILDRGAKTAREFATVGTDIVSRFSELDGIDRQNGVVGGALLRGLRRYLVAQATAPRCSDSLTEGRAIGSFNSLVDRRGQYVPGLTAIAQSESRPQRMAGPVRYDYLWQSVESRRLRIAV